MGTGEPVGCAEALAGCAETMAVRETVAVAEPDGEVSVTGAALGGWVAGEVGESIWLQASKKAPRVRAPAPVAAAFRKSRRDSLVIGHLHDSENSGR